jgi:hypothetical protein
MLYSLLLFLQLAVSLSGSGCDAFRLGTMSTSTNRRTHGTWGTSIAMSSVATSTEFVNIARKLVSASSSTNFANDMLQFLSEDVELSGPKQAKTIGKKAYLEAVGPEISALLRAVPDLQVSAYGVEIDPKDANTVWLKLKQRGTVTGPLSYKGDVLLPNKKAIEFPVEMWSLRFKSGLISRVTKGYVVDRTTGNTGGLLGLDGVATLLGEGPAKLSTLPVAVAIKQFFSRNRKM